MKKLMIITVSAALMFAGCVKKELIRPEDKQFPEKEFLYMEEVYAYAKNSFNAGKFDEATVWFDRLDEDYPDNPYKAESLFIRGYIAKDFRDDIPSAEKFFKELINNYPGSELYESAKFELEHMNDPDFRPEFEK